MKDRRKNHFMLCLLFFYILILPVTAALTCFAENYPELDNIDQSLYLPEKHQFFHRPDGGFVLVSSDNSEKSMVSLLDNSGNMDFACNKPVQNLKYVYEKASPAEGFLYIIAMEPHTDVNAVISRIDLKTGKLIYNRIINCNFDFSRDFRTEAGGKFFLVAVPAEQKINADTKASVFHFQEVNAATIAPEPPEPEPGESSNSGSSSSASEPPASSSAPSEPTPELPSSISTCRFEKPVTIEALQATLDANRQGGKVRVFSFNDRSEIKSGSLGTGMIVQTILNGKTETAYIAVIPGDLDGSGTVTDYDYRLLCDYFTQTATGSTPVLTGPYLEAANLSGGKLPETGDLLKIKRLVKQGTD